MARLFLIPTSLGTPDGAPSIGISELNQIKHLKHFIVETPKVGRAHLKTLNLTTPLQELDIQELNKHQHELEQLILPLLNGEDIGLISDCGMPAIADPGSAIIDLAHHNNIQVVPLVGPCSLILALAGSGLNGQNFAFCGYLPIDAASRSKRLKILQELITKYKQSQIIIEAPFRNLQLFDALIKQLDPSIKLSLAINLMSPDQLITTHTIKKWQSLPTPNLHKQEVVFVVGV